MWALWRRVICDLFNTFCWCWRMVYVMDSHTFNLTSSIIYFVTWIGLRAQAGLSSNELFFLFSKARLRWSILNNVNIAPDSIMMKSIVTSLLIILTVDVNGWFLAPTFIHIVQHSGVHWWTFAISISNIISAVLYCITWMYLRAHADESKRYTNITRKHNAQDPH